MAISVYFELGWLLMGAGVGLIVLSLFMTGVLIYLLLDAKKKKEM